MDPQERLRLANSAVDAIIDSLSEIVASGQTLPDELANELAAELNEAVNLIQRLQGEIEAVTPTDTRGIPPGADLLWILSGENPDVFRQYLQTFPDPELNQLSQNPIALNRIVAELSRRITTTTGEVSPAGVPQADLQSSNVYGFKYNPKTKKLIVQFQGKGASGQGPVYKYDSVPAPIFKMFASGAIPAKTSGSNKFGKWWRFKVPSLGAGVSGLLKAGGYSYQRVA